MSSDSRDPLKKDFWGGLFLTGAGVLFSVGASLHYPLGTLVDMGPGMFPMGLGILLAALGALIMLPALVRGGFGRLAVDGRSLLAIAGGTLAFILTVERFGLAVAVLSLTWLSSLAVKRLSTVRALGLGVALTAVIWLVFVYGLGVPLQLLAWNLR
jgi:hypothetical protein